MKLSEAFDATRIHGTLTIDLDDGSTATIEIDLNVGDEATRWGVERHYGPDEEPFPWGPFTGTIPDSTTYAIRVPTDITTGKPPFVLTVPSQRRSSSKP